MTIEVDTIVRVTGRPALIGTVREMLGTMAFVEFPSQEELVGVKVSGLEPVE